MELGSQLSGGVTVQALLRAGNELPLGQKVISALGGDTIRWLALMGIAGALMQPFVAFWVGIKVFWSERDHLGRRRDGRAQQHTKPERDHGGVPQFGRCRLRAGQLCVHDGSGPDRWIFLDDPVLTYKSLFDICNGGLKAWRHRQRTESDAGMVGVNSCWS